MPLKKSGSPEAFNSNVGTLTKEIGVSPHVKSKAQALAIAFDIKRKNRADGGGMHTGPIVSTVPGRTDHHPIDVPSGAYVLPAECVSNLGENNTLAGLEKLRQIFSGSQDSIRKFLGAAPPKGRAAGGNIGHDGSPVPIMAAGGEYKVKPQQMLIIGIGNIKQCPEVLDKLVIK